MATCWRYSWLLLVLSPALHAEVIDGAGLFKPGTVKQADQDIAKMREETHKDLVVVTMVKPPEDAKSANLEDAGELRRLFGKWMEGRVKGTDFDGVYVVICQKPRHIQVMVYPEKTQEQFTAWYQKLLLRRLIGKIQPDNPNQTIPQEFWNRNVAKLWRKDGADAGLREAVTFVSSTFDSLRPVDKENFYLSLGIMGGMLIFWLILSIARGQLRKRGPKEAGVYDADDSGRSIAVLGGGIGAVAGEWLVQHVFRRKPDVSVPAPLVTELPPEDGLPPAPPPLEES
jgi:hypothetical protein